MRACVSGPGLCALLMLACSGAPPPKTPSEGGAPHSRATEPLLASAAALTRQAGAGPLEALGHGVHVPGDSLGNFLVVERGECALLLARGSESVIDIDLYAFEDNGAEWGRDEAPDGDPALLLCPDESLEAERVRLYVAARIAQGSGLVALGVVRVPRERGDRVLTALQRQDPQKLPLTAWANLDTLVMSHLETLGGGFRQQRRTAIPVDARLPTTLSATVAQDTCLDILVVAGGEAKQLELEIVDGSHRVVSRGRSAGTLTSSVLCSPEVASPVTLRVRPHAGRGTAAVVLSELSDPASIRQLDPELAVTRLIPGPALQETTPRESRSPRPSPGKIPLGPFDLRVGQLTFVELGVEGCSRVDLLPRAPLVGHRATLVDQRGRTVAEASGTTQTSLFACAPGDPRTMAVKAEPPTLSQALRERHAPRPPPSRASLRLTLEATRRAGPLSVDVHPGRTAPPELGAAPLAASRLLALAFDAGLLEIPEDIGRVALTEAQLDRVTRLQLEVPSARCLTVLAALGAGARGLAITAIDSETGLPLDHQTANVAGKVRACGDAGRTRPFVVELRATDAPGPLLVSTRQTPLGSAPLVGDPPAQGPTAQDPTVLDSPTPTSE